MFVCLGSSLYKIEFVIYVRIMLGCSVSNVSERFFLLLFLYFWLARLSFNDIALMEAVYNVKGIEVYLL